jgi:hypothetical protein
MKKEGEGGEGGEMCHTTHSHSNLSYQTILNLTTCTNIQSCYVVC